MQIEVNAAGQPLSNMEQLVAAVDKTVIAWGAEDADTVLRVFNSQPWNGVGPWLLENYIKVWREIGINYPDNGLSLLGCRTYGWDAVVYCIGLFNPKLADGDPTKIAIYANKRDFDRNPKKRTVLKPNKAVRRILPWLTEAQAEKLGDALKDAFMIDVNAFTLKCSDAAEDFAHAYTHEQSGLHNLDTSRSRKSLANSCMRYNFDDLPYHPATAYGSGDFWMVWLEDAKGRIAGRCVVRKDPCRAGPVYGNCQAAVEKIEAYIEGTLGGEVNAFDDGEWIGARLKAIEHRGDLIAPYLDCSPQSGYLDGGYIVISRDGEIDLGTTSGLTSERETISCCCCGDRIDVDEVYYGDGDDPYCASCFDQEFFYCDYSGEYHHNSDRVEVFFIRNRTTRSEYWAEHYAERYAVYCDGPSEWWKSDDVFYDHEGNPITPDEAEEDYFFCDLTSEYYPNHMRVVLDGDDVSETAIDPDCHTYNETTGEWETCNAA